MKYSFLQCFLFCVIVIHSPADTLVVTTLLDDGSSGSLRKMIADADAGDTIVFEFESPQTTISLSQGSLVIDKSLVIDASSLDSLLTIRGSATRVFSVDLETGESATLRSLIITGGVSASGGVASDPRRNGGGIYHDGGVLFVQRCQIIDNLAGDGAPGGYGGGIYTTGGVLNLYQCEVSGNSAGVASSSGTHGGRGGGIYAESSDCILNRCTIANNQAGKAKVADLLDGVGGSGGGIMFSGGTQSMGNCTLAGNRCGDGAGSGLGGNGGGIFSSADSLVLEHCTITDNTSGNHGPDGVQGQGNGEGIRNGGGTLEIRSSIIAGNGPTAGADVTGSRSETGSNLLETSIAIDPMLGLLGDYGGRTRTMPVLSGSPALDMADGSSTTNDQRGVARAYGTADLGAYEAGGETWTVNTRLDENDGIEVGGLSLREAIDAAEPYAEIGFDPGIFNAESATVVLVNGALGIDRSLTIDASSLLDGVTLDANGVSRVMSIRLNEADRVVLRALTFTGGVDEEGAGLEVYRGMVAFDDCTISGNRAEDADGGGLFIKDSVVSFSDCTVAENEADFDRGGGLYAIGSELTFEDCTISGNLAGNGGAGIFVADAPGPISLSRCHFDSNIARQEGGGIAVYRANISLEECVISGNASNTGGGVYLHGDDSGSIDVMATLNLCRISDNSASTGEVVVIEEGGDLTSLQAYGGGVHAEYIRLEFVDCTLEDNAANGGGGLSILNLPDDPFDSTEMTRCTFSGNSAMLGGGVFGLDSVVTMQHLTVAGNTAQLDGGGMFFGGPGGDSNAAVLLGASTIAGNHAGGAGGGVVTSGIEAISVFSCILSGNTGSANPGLDDDDLTVDVEAVDMEDSLIGVYAHLAPLGEYGGPTQTMPPLPGSPAVDARTGLQDYGPDQRGVEAALDGDGDGTATWDIGAVELQPHLDLPAFWPLDIDGDGNAFGIEYALSSDTPGLGLNGEAQPQLGLGASGFEFAFTLNEEADSATVWSVWRSSDLSVGSWEEILRYQRFQLLLIGPGVEFVEPASAPDPSDAIPATIRIRDNNAPESSAFYRFASEWAPAPPD
ncbi:MAG: choice-of-anchor Q domain-containing protein [Verrucomicrobiales bacterium]